MKHQRGTTRALRGLAALGAAALAAALIPAQRAAADPAVVTSAPPEDGRSHTVALITGDRVAVAPDGGLTFLPGEGRENIGHRWVRSQNRTLVLPDDAAALVASGTVERRLFDVTGLIEDGFADRSTLPLIVAGGTGARLAADGSGTLESIGATTTTPADLGDWWSGIASARRASDVGHVWLDSYGEIALDPLFLDGSVPQVGAPTAWQAGFDGTGVTVAVLDTGYDPTHPDLAGRVAGARDFTGTSPEAVDDHGHGTHVASILAGTGAASDGRYKGVAPGASLLIGKVCDNYGRCPASKVIEAMEWAADEGATAISMSLGWPVWGDQPNPVALAADAISERTGTLVVAAAGNTGGSATVEAPATADSALAVASVTKSDEYSEFSSKGPRASDRAAKPDIAAPGTDITAAHAAGTPGEGPYATHSGTSMSTPHVTGAVALLKQRHPDWSGPRLKAALMNSAKVLDGQTAYQQGAGRLDVARAFAQDVTGDGSVSFAYTTYPAPAEPSVKTVSYTNDGTADVTLNLSATGPEGLFTVDATSVTVPAKGTATVNVSLHPGAFPGGGDFPGSLLATAGGVAVHTVLTASREREAYTLTLSATPRAGEEVSPFILHGFNPDTEEDVWFVPDGDGTSSSRVAPGRYVILGGIESTAPGEDLPRLSFVGRDVTVTADTAQVFDLTTGSEGVVDALDREDEVSHGVEATISVGAADHTSGTSVGVYGSYGRFFTVPDAAPAGLETRWSMDTTLTTADTRYDLVDSAAWIPATLDMAYTDAELFKLTDTYETQAGTDPGGSRHNVQRRPENLGTVSLPVAMPSTTTTFLTPGHWEGWLQTDQDEWGNGRQGEVHEFDATAGGSARQRWNAAPLGYAFGDRGIPYRYGQGAFFFSSDMLAGVNGGGGWGGFESLKVTMDGKPIATRELGQYFEVPDEASGRFTVTVTGGRDVPWSSIGKRSTASWTFDSAPTRFTELPVTAVRLNATGVRDGYAPARLPQLVTLTEDHTATKPKTISLTFEVSYDDGATWVKVPVIRAGKSAYAVLVHPAGATSVSTRMSTVDAGGDTSEQTMIRSYALR